MGAHSTILLHLKRSLAIEILLGLDPKFCRPSATRRSLCQDVG